MLTRLRCENFRGFRLLDVELTDITAFLGPNSSGKTTALHAVRLGCDALRLALEADSSASVESDGSQWVVVAKDVLVTGSQLLPLADWRALFVDQVVGEGVSFKIGLTFDPSSRVQEIDVRVDCARNERLKLTVRARSDAAVAEVAQLKKKSPLINQRLTEFLRKHSPVAVFVPPFYGVVTDEEVRARVVIDRLLGSGDQSHVVRNLVASLEPEVFERLNAFLAESIGATLTYRTSGDALQTESPMRVRFRDSNGDLELSAAGAGLVNLVALYSGLSRWRRETAERAVLFLLDEPEAHLHPRLQAASTALLGRVVTREFGAQLLLATHSVDILNRLAADGHRLLRCDRRASPSAVSLESDSALFEDLREWADLTPYTAINFLAARRVLFVEGESDKHVIPFLGELRYRNDPERLRRFRSWAVVRLKGSGNRPVADLLARMLASEAVRTAASTDSFDSIVVLDRDFERTPGTSEHEDGQVQQTTIVWPVHSLESLLVTPSVLTRWLRAHLGASAPSDLEARVQAAVSAADADETLRKAAQTAVSAARVEALMRRDGAAALANGASELRRAIEDALRCVAGDPAGSQRGKDRARFVLGHVRAGLAPRARAHLRTDVCELVLATDTARIGDPVAAVPAPVQDLLDRMTRS